MTDFLLELRSEEIPARMQAKARDDLARLFAAELGKAGIEASEIVTYATPRRLALIARGLPLETASVSEETKGPRTSAPSQALEGFLRKTGLSQDQLEDRDGVWFAVVNKPGRKTADVLAEAIPAIVRAFPWPKSMRWGAASASTESLRWVRPLQGVVALLGEEVVPFEIAGIASGAATLGHRFHHPGEITIGSAADYVEKLRACHIIVDSDERARLIREAAARLAAEAGLYLIEDEGLVAENAGLTEWPVPLLGRFDEAFLTVPPQVIQLTARVNQKYFVCRDRAGKLANAFICTANIQAADCGAKIVEGNRKVLAARLSDAKFFYETDLKTPLDEQAKKLDKIVFHEKLGTVADKVERVAKLARWLVEEGIVTEKPLPFRGGVGGGAEPRAMPLEDRPHPNPSPEGEGLKKLAALAERAARLAKADLVTGMVGEFPELQGLMGGYYAAAQGEPPEVAEAIRDHYKPVGQGDDVPTAPVTVAVSLADKLDTVLGFFASRLPPTGSKDPFALRRAALGAIALLLNNEARGSLRDIMEAAYRIFATSKRRETLGIEPAVGDEPGGHLVTFWFEEIEGVEAGRSQSFFVHYEMTFDRPDWRNLELGQATHCPPLGVQIPEGDWSDYPFVESFSSFRQTSDELLDFFADRLKVQQREAGVRHDLIDAVFALGGEDDLVRLLARVKALQAFITTEDGANLLTGYRRAANILKKEGWDGEPQPTRHPGLEPGSRFSAGQEEAGPRLGGRGDELGYEPQPEEAALISALDAAAPAAADAVAREDFEAAMAALASLRAPIDAFFDKVTVNDADPAKRTARLALLARIRDAVHGVADFSKIEG